MSPGSQRTWPLYTRGHRPVWLCPSAHSTCWGQLWGPHCLQVLVPALSGVGVAQNPHPLGGGDLFYGLSLRINGFYWPLGSNGFHSDLAQEIRPLGAG